jgi:hypothetical protein
MPTGSLSVDRLREEIAGAQYREAADTFCRLIIDEGQPLRNVVHSAVSAAAPFVQVPSHLMKKPDGEMRGVNYDHTILGWRGALKLTPHLSRERSLLPTVQAMWYAPQGLNIWEQIICEFPGHYARDSEKCNLKYPGEDPDTDRFDGPAWSPPKIHFEDHGPIYATSVEEGLGRLLNAIAEGDRTEAYGLFLGLTREPANRERLKEAILFAGIIDLQDTLINRGGYQNIGHKALRARALVDIADYFGWDNAHEIIYTVVPDLGCSPRLYGLWTEISNVSRIELAGLGPIPKRSTGPLTERELDQLTYTLLWGGPYEVNAIVSTLLRRGAGLLDVTDGIAVGYQRYLMDVLEHPSAFSHPMHSFDYLNVVNHWLRTYDNPHQPKAVYMAARFINDAFRANAMFPRDPKVELAPRAEYRPYADEIAVDRLLPVLQEAILAQDAPRAGALVDSYLERTAERKELLETITYAACHWQNDPHVMRNCISSIEEWTANQTSRRDDVIRGYVKHQSRYIKRAKAHECLDLYTRHFFS